MNNELIIEVHRDGYSRNQIDHTLTVGELIEYLEQFDEDMPVYTSHDNGYTYGGIDWEDFTELEGREEESEDEYDG